MSNTVSLPMSANKDKDSHSNLMPSGIQKPARKKLSRLFSSTSPKNIIQRVFDTRENREFLPAYLEILETPPTPYALGFCWALVIAFVALVIWCLVANLDIHAVAMGRVQPSGRSKTVQSYEISKVKRIYIANGARVSAGSPLIDLDATEADADLISKKGDLEALEAQIVRRSTVISSVRVNNPTAVPNFGKNISITVADREKEVTLSEIKQYFVSKDALRAQLNEKLATQRRFSSSLDARYRLMSVLKERADMRETLVQKMAGTRAALLDALQQVEQLSAEIAYDQGQLGEAQAASNSIEKRIDQLTEDTISKQQEYLSDAFQKRDVVVQEVVKASVRKERLQLISPISGSVQQLAVNTIGQVVTAGQTLMVIVPDDSQYEIEAQVLNKDIGFVSVGQRAVIKVDAFPYVKYGTIEGKVVQISQDAVADKEAANASDAISVAGGRNSSPNNGTFNSQNLIYPVIVKLDKDYIDVDGRAIKINAGMTVSVEIHTGQRSVMEYVLTPIRETTSTAAHER